MPEDFVHLHVHSDYSLLDGACRHDGLIERCQRYGMGSVAVTDHGNLFGAMEFYSKATAKGIKPILGCEVYTVPGGDDQDPVPRGAGQGDYNHLLLLCETYEGWRNLQRLVSEGYRKGFYYKPRVSHHLLRKYAKGLIATSACLKGEVAQAIVRDRNDLAEENLRRLRDIFELANGGGKPHFYVEVQANGVPDQRKANAGLVELARRLSIPLVGTGDVHYLDADDKLVQDVLVCINTGKLLSDKNRMRMDDAILYFRAKEEMRKAFDEWGLPSEALAATAEIAERCQVDLKKEQFGKVYLPKYDPPPKKTGEPWPSATDFFRDLCEKGLRRRYLAPDLPRDAELPPEIAAAPLPPEVQARYEEEFAVIDKMGFVPYLLIVWDFINWAKSQGIPVGPGRGSAAGSILCYAIGITDIDPLRYDLLFERFLNKERVSMPDIDVDFCQERRGEVIEYVRRKYGADAVAQIITFGTMAAKSVIRDVGRVMGLPLADVDRVAKLVPNDLQVKHKKLKDAFVEVPELAEQKNDPRFADLFKIAEKLEGFVRNASTHAAGVVIGDGALEERVPLYVDPKSPGEIVTQFTMNLLEKECGLIKMDFLGLKTLTVIEWALRHINKNRPPEKRLDLSALKEPMKTALRDPQEPSARKLYELLCRGETKGVFQFESSGYRDLLVKLRPDGFEDIIALGAMYRPGPLGAGMVDAYVNRKHGREAVTYLHPKLAEVLAPTYGCMLYQEQIMRITNVLAGFTLSQADSLRKAMGKKKPEEMAKYKGKFIEGAAKVSQCPPEVAEKIWEQMEYFAGYGFNRCLVGSTTIVDARTGERTTVGGLFASMHGSDAPADHGGGPATRPFFVHALGEDMRVHVRRVTDVLRNGRKPVFELRTAQGKRIVATGNHPFRTLDGWTNLEGLRPGDFIAAPRRLPVEATRCWPRHELIALAGLLSEGSTCHPTSLSFSGSDRALVEDFAAAATAFPRSVARVTARANGRLEVCVRAGTDGRRKKSAVPWNARRAEATAVAAPAPRRSGMFEWAGRLGILGKKTTEKFVPPEVFTLADEDVALFLGRLWAGDGFIANATHHVPFYATSSPQLARDVQALLLRLGVVSGIREKSFRYRETRRAGYTVTVVGEGSRETFAEVIAPHCAGRERAVELLRKSLAETARGRTSKDTIPGDVRGWVDEERRRHGLSWSDVEVGAGVSMKELTGRGSAKKVGFRRSTIARLGAFFDSQKLLAIANSDVFWDRIVAIEPAGIEETFDLTVERDHNFVADGLIVHNSHSAAYGFVTFQTAWLKANYPAEFMAALITSESSSVEKVADYVEEAERMGIEVLPPDVNESDIHFSVVGEKKIRYGLIAIRGLGEKAIEAILEARKRVGRFRSIFDLCAEVDLTRVNKAVIEAMLKAGALRSLEGNRAQQAAVLEKALAEAQRQQAEKRSGQKSFFDLLGVTPGAAPPRTPLPAIPEWPEQDILQGEKETLGFYLTSHPLKRHRAALRAYAHATARTLGEHAGKEILVGGMVQQVRSRPDKKGNLMAFLTVEDLEGSFDAVVFSRVYEQAKAHLRPEAIVFLKGKVDAAREQPSLIVDEVVPIEKVDEAFARSVTLVLGPEGLADEKLDALARALRECRGSCPVVIEVRKPLEGGRELVGKVRVGPDFYVTPGEALRAMVAPICGAAAIRFVGDAAGGRALALGEDVEEEPALVAGPAATG